MEGTASLLNGFAAALTPFNLVLMFVGVLLGVAVGVLPGFGGANGLAILLPLTFAVPPTLAIFMLSGIYWGVLFGGIITSILFNIPGEPWSVPTTFDGHPMPPEIFAIQFLTFASFVGIGPGSPFKIIASICLGFALAVVGLDSVSGQLRMTFGFAELLLGFNFLIAVIGLFAIAGVLLRMESGLAFAEAAARINPRVVVRIPFDIIAPIILVACAVSAYTVNSASFDLVLMVVFGFAGWVLNKLGYPIAPMVLALVLGDQAESAFRQSMLLSQGSLTIFWSNWVVGTIMAVGLLFLMWPFFGYVRARTWGAGRRGDSEVWPSPSARAK